MYNINLDKLSNSGYFPSQYCKRAENCYNEIFFKKRKNLAKVILIENDESILVPIGIIKFIGNKSFMSFDNIYDSNGNEIIKSKFLYRVDNNFEDSIKYYKSKNYWDLYKLENEFNLKSDGRKLDIYSNKRLEFEIDSEFEKLKQNLN